eukprot:3240069-Prymnesium_polylepis.1
MARDGDRRSSVDGQQPLRLARADPLDGCQLLCVVSAKACGAAAIRRLRRSRAVERTARAVPWRLRCRSAREASMRRERVLGSELAGNKRAKVVAGGGHEHDIAPARDEAKQRLILHIAKTRRVGSKAFMHVHERRKPPIVVGTAGEHRHKLLLAGDCGIKCG